MEDVNYFKGVLAAAGLFLFAGCSNYPIEEADAVAESTIEAIIDRDYKTIYELSSEKHRAELIDENRGEANFKGRTEEEIQKMEPFNSGDYAAMKEHGDYFFGAHYGFYEDEGSVLYYLDGYVQGSRKTFNFELTEKAEGDWVIKRYDDWPSSLVHDQKQKYQSEIEEEEEDFVHVIHRGEYYER